MSISQFLETVNMLVYMAKGIKVTDVIKVATKLTLRYLGGPDVVTKVLISRRGRQKRENLEDGSTRKTYFNDAGFENGGMGPLAKECR